MTTQIENLEAQVREYEGKIETKHKHIEQLDRIYEQRNHQLYFLNSQIEGLDLELRKNKVAGAAKQKQEFEERMLVLKQSEYQTSVKLRKTFQNYFLSLKQKYQLQANKQSLRMEVQAVAVYLLDNPHQFVQRQWEENEENDFKEGFSVPYKCASFLLKKTSTLGQIFEVATLYWGVSKMQYTLYDSNCNCLDLLHEYFAENFFSAHKESQPHATLYIWRRELYINFLLDEQKKYITITGRDSGQVNQAEENMKQIDQEMENFVDVQPGLKLYQGQAQDEQQKGSGSISIGWKILLLLMSGTYLILLYINGMNAFDFKTVSYMRESITNYLYQTKYFPQETTDFPGIYQKLKYLTITDRVFDQDDGGEDEGNDEGDTDEGGRLLQDEQAEGEEGEELQNEEEDLGYQDIIRFQFIQMREKMYVFQAQSGEHKCTSQELKANITKCIYSIYSDEHKNTLDLVATDGEVKDWGKYWAPGDSGIQPFSGILSSYDGSGYQVMYQSYEYVDDRIEMEEQQGMFNVNQTKMVGIDMVFYDDSRQVFYVVYYFFEISPSYEVLPQLILIAYRVNSHSATDPRLQSFNVFEYVMLSLSGLLSFILMFISYKETYNRLKIKFGGVQIRRDFFEFMQLGFLYNLLILILQIISFIYIYDGPNENTEVFTDEYKNIMAYAEKLKFALIIRGVLILLVGFNTLKLYQISESVAFIQAMAAKGAENIAMIILFAFTVLAAVSMVFFMLFHQKLVAFSTYYKSFISVCSIFFMGNFRLWNQGVEIEPMVMVIMTFLIFIIFAYGSVVLINAVLQEVYRTISYRTDHLQTINEFYATIDQIKDKIMKSLQKCAALCRKS